MSDLLDLTILEGRKILGRSFLEVLFEKFSIEAPKIIGEMKALHQGGQTAAFSDKAHLFKGLAANFGAIKVTQFCQELQVNPESEQFQDTEAWVLQLTALVEETGAEIKNFINQLDLD